jgi:hypothetical protein
MPSLAKKNNSHTSVAKKVWFTKDFICLELSDGREIKTPLDFYPKLKNATEKQRNQFEIIGLRTGIHWKDLDEDLSVEAIVLGLPSLL